MELIRKTRKLGNSSGVLLPKKMLGYEVKITVVKRPVDVRKQSLKILYPILPELQGVYLLNSNPFEILAVSSQIKNIIAKDSMKISIIPFSLIKRDLKTSSELRKKIMNAKAIFNKSLLLELREYCIDNNLIAKQQFYKSLK